ncbi:pyridoxamine 5'-phosphate oxidase [Hasllibacter halocynthiae]|uniref:Pyridoxamine 5'-phosphate oxidase n=1 Tax=Hasllibacter halocynthiae TaxID=595589 RepID=A0A2T0X7Z0_9RHOB|nr:pyridoxamine 5'-phosphate oxidase [Hasllibacter halocynthiae]PRY95070.1 pyridoxamine 5'-phosphate oxidase [Hasllibacter halocynthiae]
MEERTGIFAGPDPVAIAARWLEEAGPLEPNDPNAMQLATVDEAGMPDVRTVLLKEIEEDPGAFLFYTNYEGAKARQIEAAGGRCAFVMHWKSLRRQVRVRGVAAREDGAKADAYYASRPLGSRIGAWASPQSRPVEGRDELAALVEAADRAHGDDPARPPHWGGYRIAPQEIELWADGESRLHDRFRFTRPAEDAGWRWTRLGP